MWAGSCVIAVCSLMLFPVDGGINFSRLCAKSHAFLKIFCFRCVYIHAAFCLFSYHTGNMVEWCLPQDIDLEGVEFKSMASGSHKIQSDFM